MTIAEIDQIVTLERLCVVEYAGDFHRHDGVKGRLFKGDDNDHLLFLSVDAVTEFSRKIQSSPENPRSLVDFEVLTPQPAGQASTETARSV